MKTIKQYGNDSMNRDVIDVTKEALPALSSKVMFWRPKYLKESICLDHIPFYFWLVDALKPELIIESNIGRGVGYFSFCQAVEKLNLDATCQGFGLHSNSEAAEYNHDNYREFSFLNIDTFKESVDSLPDASIDLFSMKDSEVLLKDIKSMEILKKKLSPKSVVLIHNSQNKSIKPICKSLKDTYDTFEFLYGGGLLVVGFGESPSSKIASFLQQSESISSTRLVQNIYGRLGESCRESWVNRKLTNEVEVLTNDISGYKLAAESTEKENKKLIQDLDASMSQIEKIVKQFQNVENVNKSQLTELAQKEDLLNRLKYDLATLKDAKSNIERDKLLLDKSNNDLQQSVVARYKELAEITKIANGSTERLNKERVENEKIKKQLLSAEEENKVFRDTQDSLKRSLRDLQNKAKDLEVDKAKIKKELSDSREKSIGLSEISKAKEAISKENSKLRKELGMLELDQEAAANIISDQKKQILSLERSLEERYEELGVLTKLLDEASSVKEYRLDGSRTRVKLPILTRFRAKRLKKKNADRRLSEEVEKIEKSGLFDKDWYLKHYPDSRKYKKGLIAHYLTIGYRENYNPSREFDGEWYLASNPDVFEAGVNPLLHYIEFGETEGRKKSSVFS